jgi:uncharacterized protein
MLARLTADLVRIAVGFAVTIAVAFAAGTDGRQLDRLFPRDSLQIATPDARVHTFKIWIADSDARRARGLMFVRDLAADEGMLFIYPQPQPISMWMKNTYIPLDMVFVDARGRVESVAANTTPESLATVSSKGEVLAVVELRAGTAARLNIRPGARVMHEVFETPTDNSSPARTVLKRASTIVD